MEAKAHLPKRTQQVSGRARFPPSEVHHWAVLLSRYEKPILWGLSLGTQHRVLTLMYQVCFHSVWGYIETVTSRDEVTVGAGLSRWEDVTSHTWHGGCRHLLTHARQWGRACEHSFFFFFF